MNRAGASGTMEITFEKLHGNGNDFILIDEFEKTVIPDEMKPGFARSYCDRRFGIGADGVLYLSRSDSADLRMRIIQPDESEAPMCGNGIRCFVKHAFDAGYVEKTCTVETGAGIIGVEMGYVDDTFMASIGMPEPRFSRAAIPASGDGEYKETIQGYEVFAVNTGVPHAVIFTDDLDSFPLAEIGPLIRHHASFPEGANVNIVVREGEDLLSIRTFERGVEDETLLLRDRCDGGSRGCSSPWVYGYKSPCGDEGRTARDHPGGEDPYGRPCRDGLQGIHHVLEGPFRLESGDQGGNTHSCTLKTTRR